MQDAEKVEIGYTLPKERWQEAAKNLEDLGNALAASLRAAGWKCVGQAGGLRWTGKRRPEVDLCPAQMKLRFEIGGNNDDQSRNP